MLAIEAVEVLLKGGVTVSVDTNKANSTRLMKDLSDAISRLNEAWAISAAGVRVTLVVSAIAFAELLLDHHQSSNSPFNFKLIDRFLASTGIGIEGFLDLDARHFAHRVWQLVGDDEAWQRAKINNCFAELRLSARKEELLHPKARCSATLDWLIASQAEGREWLLVTEDRGDEFQGVERITTFETLKAALDRLV